MTWRDRIRAVDPWMKTHEDAAKVCKLCLGVERHEADCLFGLARDPFFTGVDDAEREFYRRVSVMNRALKKIAEDDGTMTPYDVAGLARNALQGREG